MAADSSTVNKIEADSTETILEEPTLIEKLEAEVAAWEGFSFTNLETMQNRLMDLVNRRDEVLVKNQEGLQERKFLRDCNKRVIEELNSLIDQINIKTEKEKILRLMLMSDEMSDVEYQSLVSRAMALREAEVKQHHCPLYLNRRE